LIVQGNVGIGTSNPGVNALQVTGNVVTQGFTSNATNTVFNFDTLTVPFVNATQIGVGTTSSTYPFDVLGIVRAGSTVASSIYLTNSEVKWRGDGTAHFSIFNQNSTFQIRNTSANFEPGTAGSNLVTVTSTGNVGIGTTSPGSPLQIHCGDNYIQGISFSSAAAGAVSSSDFMIQRGPSNNVVGGSAWNTSNCMIFHTPNEGVATTGPVGYLWMSSTSRLGMFYDVKNSRLGIGTTNPGSVLHTAINSATATTIATFENMNTTTTTAKSFSLQFYGNGAGGQKDVGAITMIPTDGNFGYSAMAFSVRGPFSGGSESVAEVMRCTRTGNNTAVGIGTASPGYTLDVGSFGVDGGTIRIVSSSSCAFRMMEVNDTYGFSFTNVAASRMSIKRHSGLQAGTEIISILRDNSFVGIGITNPTKPLVVTRPGGAGNFPAIMVANNGNGSGFRISTYDMTADGQAYMGLGTDMGGNAYEHSLLFPYGSTGQGIQTVGWYNGTTYSTRAYIQTGSTNWVSVSDIRAKDIVRPISNVLPLLSNLSTIVYTLKDDIIKTSHLGLIAQEVALVFPEACDIPTDPEQRMGITYTELVPVLVEAVKELAAKNADLEARLAALEAK
jgi:hypothetical protein